MINNMDNPIIEEYEDLKPWQVRFIIRLFAEACPAQDISHVFPDIYGSEISLDLLHMMHPEYMDGNMLPDEVVDQYWRMKGELIKLIPLPVVSKVHRLQMLDRLRLIYESRIDYERLLRILELSEKETKTLYQDLLVALDKITSKNKLPIKSPYLA